MHRTPFRLALLTGLVLGLAGAEPLPAPRAVPPAQVVPVLPYPPPMPYRVSRYQHWQYYGVSPTGAWLPRVIDAGPYGAWYAANGHPYFWVTTHMTQYMPYASD
jgi:hypothetical protein